MDSQSTAQVLTEFFGYARDLSVIGVIIAGAWKARGMWDGAADFIKNVNAFMRAMTESTDLLVNNHLKHIQDSAARIEGKLDAQTRFLASQTLISTDQKDLLTDIKNK